MMAMAKKQTLTQILDAQIQAGVDRAVRGHNSKRRGKGFALDVTGSTCLEDARWSPSGTLAVTFVKGGDQYLYFDVPRSVAKQVESGEDFNELIKGGYDYE
jgi:hypothetical protein